MSSAPASNSVKKVAVNPAAERLTTLIAKPMRVVGDILGPEGVMVRGEVHGDIIVSEEGPPDTGVVFVLSGGRVQGLVSGRRIVVAGEIKGPVVARGVLQIVDDGVVDGDVYCVAIDRGSMTRVSGTVHRIQPGEDPTGEVQAKRFA
jgi:cytoskeletal protein CcmA (bactofilin family)